jgi:hypothetical protein
MSAKRPPHLSSKLGEAPAFNPKFSSPGYYSDEEGNQRLILLVERGGSFQNNRLQFPLDRLIAFFEQL